MSSTSSTVTPTSQHCSPQISITLEDKMREEFSSVGLVPDEVGSGILQEPHPLRVPSDRTLRRVQFDDNLSPAASPHSSRRGSRVSGPGSPTFGAFRSTSWMKKKDGTTSPMPDPPSLACNRRELDKLIANPKLPHAAMLELQAARKRPTLEVSEITKRILIDPLTPVEISGNICKVIVNTSTSCDNLAHAAAALRRRGTQDTEGSRATSTGEELENLTLQGASFKIFPPTNPLRVWCARIIFHPVTTSCLTALILFNSLVIAFTDTKELKGNKPHSQTTTAFLLIDEIAVYIFFLEYMMKMLALGVFDGPYTLFGRKHGRWFAADFFIVLLSFALVVSNAGSGLSMLRAFRAVRPLRSVRAFVGIRTILDSLMQSVQLLGDSVALLCFSLFLWGLIGIEFFSGVLHNRCMLDEGNGTFVEAIPVQYCSQGTECTSPLACRVSSPVYPFVYANFDNMLSSLLTIFHVITLASWADVMHAHMDASTHAVGCIYFISLVLFVSWIVLNLFVAVINTVFCTIRGRHLGSGFGGDADFVDIKHYWDRLTACLLRLVKSTEDVAKNVVWKEENDNTEHTTRLAVFMSSRPVEVTVNSLILINLVMEASQHRYMSSTHESVLFYSEHVFAAIYLAELLLRLGACGSLAAFLSERWNVFDTALVVISYITLYVMEHNVSFLRAFRVFRAVRLIRASQAKGLRNLIDNSLKALVPAMNVMVFFVFGLFLFSGLGKSLLGDEVPPAAPYRASFDDMWKSTVSLFVIMTGDSWFVSMYHLMDPDEGVGPHIVVFYVAYYIWAVWIMLSLFTTVVLESFAVPEEEKMARIKEQKMKAFKDTPDTDGPEDVEVNLEEFYDPMTLKMKWERDPRPLALLTDDSKRPGGAATVLANTGRCWRVHMSLYLFPPTHPLRVFCATVSSSACFEYAIIGTICVSCFLLVLTSYTQPPEAYHAKESSYGWVDTLDTVVLGIFIAEMVVKVIAKGMVVGERTYLSDPWNRFDFVLLLLMSVAPSVKTLRVLRALRPLRMVRRMERMKNIMSALWKSIPMIIMVSLASLFVIIIFGLVGVTLFMAKLDYCTERGQPEANCTGVYPTQHDYIVPRVWKVREQNFDDMGSAVFTLLQVVSLNNWSQLMYVTMDTGADPPEKDSAEVYALYFMCFILIGNFFLINIFIGVIIVSINTEENVELLTDDQRNWRELAQQLAMVRPIMYKCKPTGRFRHAAFSIVESIWFSAFILFVLVTYMVVLVAQHHDQPQWLTDLSMVYNVFVTGVFMLEVLLRIAAYGRKVYFHCHWNKFDSTLVFGNMFLSVVLAASGSDASFLRYVSKTFRVGRFVRLVKRTRGIRFLLETLLRSFKAIMNAFVMLAFLLFIWGLSGVALFGSIRHQRFLNRHTNFRDFSSAVLTLFRMGTLDSWSDIMWECNIQPPACTDDSVLNDCGPSTWVTKLYFSLFYVLGSLVIYNLLIGIIIDEFAICYSTRYFDIKPAHIEDFVRTWQMEDEENAGYLPRWRVYRIVRELLDKGNTLGLRPKSVEYQLLIFHLDVIDKKSKERSERDSGTVPVSPRRRSVLEIETGAVHAPYSFKTLLLLLAKLRVPDSALTYPELQLRRQIKKKATFVYLKNKAFASMRSFHTICKLEKSDASQAATLANIRKDLRSAAPCRETTIETDPDAFDADAIDHEYRKEGHDKIAKRGKLALMIMRSMG